jgi:pimeloyl-ACP methyl ester carboxylesterase
MTAGPGVDAAGNKISVDYLTDRLASFLDNFVQTPPYHLVASSLGGQVVVEYAARYPDKVGRMVLLCPSGMGGQEKLPIVDGVRHHDYTALVASCFTTRGWQVRNRAYYKEKFASRASRKALLQTVRGTKKHSVRERLTSVTSPTLAVRAGRSDCRSIPSGRRSGGCRNFRMELIPCAATPALELPQIVNPLVTRFLLEGDEELPVESAAKASPKRWWQAISEVDRCAVDKDE